MLSRTASELYWLSRYMERAENTARMLDVAFTVAMMPDSEVAKEEMSAPLRIAGAYESYLQKYQTVTPEKVLKFFATDIENPSSVVSCFNAARDNALSVRSKLSSETWEAINSSWIELQKMKRTNKVRDAGAFFEWVKERSHLYRGAVYGTSLRNDAFRFLRLGTFLERADNTARILDVKYQVSEEVDENSTIDYFRWNAVLRSLGAYEAYREIYGDKISPSSVAELLILREEVPRSIRACLEAINQILPEIEGGAGMAHLRQTAVQHARLKYGDTRHILVEIGLHEFLTDFLKRIGAIAQDIQTAYMEVV